MSAQSLPSSQPLPAFLLTRQWRDGVLRLWCATELGPLLIRVTDVDAVCFIERAAPTPSTRTAPRRRPVELCTPSGDPVDALYFTTNRALADCRAASGSTRLYESDVRPAERYLMERFIRAGMTVHGAVHRIDRKSTRLNSSHSQQSRMPSSA